MSRAKRKVSTNRPRAATSIPYEQIDFARNVAAKLYTLEAFTEDEREWLSDLLGNLIIDANLRRRGPRKQHVLRDQGIALDKEASADKNAVIALRWKVKEHVVQKAVADQVAYVAKFRDQYPNDPETRRLVMLDHANWCARVLGISS